MSWADAAVGTQRQVHLEHMHWLHTCINASEAWGDSVTEDDDGHGAGVLIVAEQPVVLLWSCSEDGRHAAVLAIDGSCSPATTFIQFSNDLQQRGRAADPTVRVVAAALSEIRVCADDASSVGYLLPATVQAWYRGLGPAARSGLFSTELLGRVHQHLNLDGMEHRTFGLESKKRSCAEAGVILMLREQLQHALARLLMAAGMRLRSFAYRQPSMLADWRNKTKRVAVFAADAEPPFEFGKALPWADLAKK